MRQTQGSATPDGVGYVLYRVLRGWSITGILIRAPATLRKKPPKVSEIQTEAVTCDSNAHKTVCPFKAGMKLIPCKFF